MSQQRIQIRLDAFKGRDALENTAVFGRFTRGVDFDHRIVANLLDFQVIGEHVAGGLGEIDDLANVQYIRFHRRIGVWVQREVLDHIAFIGAADAEGVVPGAAGQNILTEPAVDDVVPGRTGDNVSPVAAADAIDSCERDAGEVQIGPAIGGGDLGIIADDFLDADNIRSGADAVQDDFGVWGAGGIDELEGIDPGPAVDNQAGTIGQIDGEVVVAAAADNDRFVVAGRGTARSRLRKTRR